MRRHQRHLLFASAALLVGLTYPAVATASLPRVVVAHVSPTYGSPTTPSTSNFTFDVVLKPNQTALTAYLAELTNPTSPNFRDFLTTSEFARRFGPSPSAVRAVKNYLRQNGLRVDHVTPSRMIIQASGTQAKIAHALSASFATYTYHSIINLALTSNASLPHDVGQYVKTVVGLNGITTLHTHYVAPKSAPRVSAPGTCGSNGVSDNSSNTPSGGGYSLTQQGRLYGLTSQWTQGHYGTGINIAMYELQSYSTSDVNTYKSCYGLTNSIQTINVDGGPQAADNQGGLEEANLDIEEAAGLAPGAAILVYQGTQNVGTGSLDTYAQIADDNSAQIVSSSWGACEYDTSSQPVAEQLIFQQMAVQGQTVFSAAGDNGSSDCVGDTQISLPASLGNPTYPDSVLSVDDPSSSPFVTGVGGLNVSDITQVPTVWDVACTAPGSPDTCPTTRNGVEGGGGGISSVWSLPTWQNAAAANVSPSPTMRMVPDLSVMADPQTGFLDYNAGSWGPVGGTSIGSPLMSALLAVAANACGVTNFGLLNPTLYTIPSSSYVDVGSVNANSNAVMYGSTSYMSGSGYDLASGLGTPAATSAFISNICPSGPQANHSLSSSSTTNVRANTTGSVITVTALDRSNNPVSGANIGLNFSTTGTAPVVVNSVSDPAQPFVIAANTSGVATFTINTASAGVVTVTPLIGSQVIGQPISITFAAPVVLHAPSAPTIKSLTALVKGIKVAVQAPSSTGGSPITHFQYSLNGKPWVSVSNALIFTISKLGTRTMYSVRLRAQNAIGISPVSVAKTITTR